MWWCKLSPSCHVRHSGNQTWPCQQRLWSTNARSIVTAKARKRLLDPKNRGDEKDTFWRTTSKGRLPLQFHLCRQTLGPHRQVLLHGHLTKDTFSLCCRGLYVVVSVRFELVSALNLFTAKDVFRKSNIVRKMQKKWRSFWRKKMAGSDWFKTFANLLLSHVAA